MKKFFVLLFFIVVLTNVESYSQTNTNKAYKADITNQFNYAKPVDNVNSPGYFSLVIKTIFILGIFTLAVYYIFKFISKRQGVNYQNLNLINIISSTPIGTNRFLLLVEVHGLYLLLGSTDNNITLIKEITDRETIAKIQIKKNSIPKTKNKNVTFGDFLRDLVGPSLKKILSKDEKKFIKNAKNRLRNLNK